MPLCVYVCIVPLNHFQYSPLDEVVMSARILTNLVKLLLLNKKKKEEEVVVVEEEEVEVYDSRATKAAGDCLESQIHSR